MRDNPGNMQDGQGYPRSRGDPRSGRRRAEDARRTMDARPLRELHVHSPRTPSPLEYDYDYPRRLNYDGAYSVRRGKITGRGVLRVLYSGAVASCRTAIRIPGGYELSAKLFGALCSYRYSA